jgi:hypothetical protein
MDTDWLIMGLKHGDFGQPNEFLLLLTGHPVVSLVPAQSEEAARVGAIVRDMLQDAMKQKKTYDFAVSFTWICHILH